MLLTFTVTFSYLLLLHTGWHFWENGHTLVDAIIRMSHKCQLFAAVRILLVSMKSRWMWLVLTTARVHPSLSNGCHALTLVRWKGAILYRLFSLIFPLKCLQTFFFLVTSALSARLWQHVVMGLVRAWSDWSGQKSLYDFNDSLIWCFTSSDNTQPSTDIPFYV